MKLKRREILAGAVAIAAPLQAQAQAPDPTEQAKAALKANRSQLDRIKLPMATEPAFVFKA